MAETEMQVGVSDLCWGKLGFLIQRGTLGSHGCACMRTVERGRGTQTFPPCKTEDQQISGAKPLLLAPPALWIGEFSKSLAMFSRINNSRGQID